MADYCFIYSFRCISMKNNKSYPMTPNRDQSCNDYNYPFSSIFVMMKNNEKNFVSMTCYSHTVSDIIRNLYLMVILEYKLVLNNIT